MNGAAEFSKYCFAKKALEAGKNVIIEKPVTANYGAADLKTAEEKRLMILEAMNIPYLPAYAQVKEHLADLGNIRIVSLNYSQYSSRYDAFKKGQILPSFDPHKAGGALMDLNVYNIHFIAGLFGEPEEVLSGQYVKGIDTSGILDTEI